MASKLAKSPKYGVIFQLTQTLTEEGADWEWEVHDVERNRAFHVTLPRAALTAKMPRFSEAEVEKAVLLALEGALEAPPEKVPGEVYEVTVTKGDVAAAAGS
jgi:hypothetical protein